MQKFVASLKKSLYKREICLLVFFGVKAVILSISLLIIFIRYNMNINNLWTLLVAYSANLGLSVVTALFNFCVQRKMRKYHFYEHERTIDRAKFMNIALFSISAVSLVSIVGLSYQTDESIWEESCLMDRLRNLVNDH